MTWKSKKLRSEIGEKLNDIIRGLIATEVSHVAMQAFLLFYDYDYGYMEIAWKLNLSDWSEARTLVYQVYDALGKLGAKYSFYVEDYVVPEDNDFDEEEL